MMTDEEWVAAKKKLHNWRLLNEISFRELVERFGVEKFGSHNIPLPIFREITPEALVLKNQLHIWSTVALGFNQITHYDEARKQRCPRTIQIHSTMNHLGNGYALEFHHYYDPSRPMRSCGEVVFYEIGLCDHQFKGAGRTTYGADRYVCSECEMEQILDSR